MFLDYRLLKLHLPYKVNKRKKSNYTFRSAKTLVNTWPGRTYKLKKNTQARALALADLTFCNSCFSTPDLLLMFLEVRPAADISVLHTPPAVAMCPSCSSCISRSEHRADKKITQFKGWLLAYKVPQTQHIQKTSPSFSSLVFGSPPLQHWHSLSLAPVSPVLPTYNNA